MYVTRGFKCDTATWGYWNWAATAYLAHPRMKVSSFIIIEVNLEWCDKSSSQIYCYHGRVALSKAYSYYQLRQLGFKTQNA